MREAPVEKLRLPLQGGSTSFSDWQLRVPPTPAHHLPRERLLQLLDGATESPITVVVAPAGAGKTTLLGAWCAQQTEVRTGWLSWDGPNRSTGQFWEAVQAVVQHMLPSADGSPRSGQTPERTPRGLLDILAAVEGERADRVVVVLDDLEPLVGEDARATSLEQMLHDMPDWFHLVVSCRQMPLLPIDRLRARGQLSEVLFDELRFSPAESLEVVTRMAPWLPREEAAAAAERAHGWAAGLQLSGVGARAARAWGSDGGSDRGSDGGAAERTELMVTDYVWHEVLAQESAELVQVLLDVSVVTTLTAGLAATLAQRDDASSLLLQAEKRGLFVTRLGSGDQLEVHGLVRSVLLAEARRRDPDRVRGSHLRAARWFQEREGIGDTELALEHWQAAGEPRSALRLLASRASALYDEGGEETISRVLATIPDAVARGELDAQIDLAWCELLVDKATFLQEVRAAAAEAARVQPASTTLGRVRMLQSIAATMTGGWSEGGQLALEALQDLGLGGWADPLGRFGANMVARDVALSESWDDEAPTLQDARAALSRDPERRLSYEGISALGCALAGRPLDALRVVAGVSDYARVKSMTILRAELATAEAIARRELGDRERARAALKGILEGHVGPVTHATALARLELVEICLDNADLEGARKLFGEAEIFFRAEFAGAEGLSWLARRGLLVALATGDLESAAEWNERVEDKFWHGIGRARLSLQRGDDAQAVEELSMVTPRCPRHRVTRGLLLAQALPDGQEAIDLYGSIVTVAVGAGMMQTVASAGAEILDVIERHPWMAPDPWLARVHRAVPPSRRTGVTKIALPGEHLTDRELGVLRMLPSRLTIREIGDELGISVNTVKFHLRVIYRKLGVGSRNEAAAMARSLRRLGRESPR